MNISNNNSEQKEQPGNNALKFQTASCNTVGDYPKNTPVLDSFSFSPLSNHQCNFNQLFSFSIKNNSIMIFIDPIRGYNSYNINKKLWINDNYDSSIKYSAIEDRALLINDDLLIVSHKNCLYFYDFSDLTKGKCIKQFGHMPCEIRGMSLIEENDSISEYSFVIFGIIDKDRFRIFRITIKINYKSPRNFNPKHIAYVTLYACNMSHYHLGGCDCTYPIGYNYQILKNDQMESIVVIMIGQSLYVWNSCHQTLVKSKQVSNYI